jgi:serine/threonine-protein kinase
MSESELIAHILDNIINNRFIKRPPLMARIEFLAIFLLGGIASYIFPRMGQLRRLAWVFGLVVLTVVAGMILFFEMGIWFKTVNIAGCLVAIFLMVSAKQLFLIEVIPRDSIETNQLVGLDSQSQGLLDLAFDKFLKLPLDSETKNLVYDLGVQYEMKGLTKKALSAFEYINKGGSGYGGLDERIHRLKESVKSSAIRSHEVMTNTSILASSSTKPRFQIGRYKILEELGRGTMGLVYKALDPKINRLLAIKTIRFSNEFDDDVVQEIKMRFFQEAEIAGKLSHPSIVTIYDMGDDGDLTYMAMELLEGVDLDKFVVKENLLPFRNVLDLVSKVADALHFAHEAGVIHRDIKPANIMLLKDDVVKVTDFGIAKAISSSRTKTGVILGTPNYMSPEQIMGQKIDPRSDIFSLGVLYFQLLTGEMPFRGDNLSSLLYEITQVEHPSVRSYNEKIPKVCERIINKALAKSSKDRFGNASEMARVIRVLASKIDQLREKRSIKKTPDIEGMI